MKDAGDRKLLLDACVLIDYFKEDREVLRAAARSLGEIIIPSPVLLEVRTASITDCEELGLTVFQPELRIITAASQRRGVLSLHDRICLLIASELQATVYSNDKPLITAASVAGVRAEWGLKLLLELAAAGEITVGHALVVANRICSRSSYLSRALQIFRSEVQRIFPEHETEDFL